MDKDRTSRSLYTASSRPAMALRQFLRVSGDLTAFQAGNVAFALWLAVAIRIFDGLPWQELLILEAIAWISTAPFYTQSAAIGAMPSENQRTFARRATAIKGLIAAAVYVVWFQSRSPSGSLAIVGFLSLLGPVLLPQWTLFAKGFGRYALALLLCRLLFVVIVHSGVGGVDLALFAYALQVIVPPLIILLATLVEPSGGATAFSLRDSVHTSIAYTSRYALIALMSANLIGAATPQALSYIALCDRVVRPVFALITPYLLRHSDLFPTALLRTCTIAFVALAALLATISFGSDTPLPWLYGGLLALEGAGAAYFVGVRVYAKSWGFLFATGFFMIGALVLFMDTSGAAALAILAASFAHAILIGSEFGENQETTPLA